MWKRARSLIFVLLFSTSSLLGTSPGSCSEFSEDFAENTQVASALGLYTGLALYNPGTTDAENTDVYTGQGTRFGPRDNDAGLPRQRQLSFEAFPYRVRCELGWCEKE